MNTRRALRIADRIDALLHQELGQGIDLQRMLEEPLYARDVLLVCEAHRDHELAELARDFRAAQQEAPPEADRPSGFGEGGTESRPQGLISSLFGAFRSSFGADALDEATRAEQVRQAERGRARALYWSSRWRGK